MSWSCRSSSALGSPRYPAIWSPISIGTATFSLTGEVIDTVTLRHGNTKVNNIALRAEAVWGPEQHSGAWRTTIPLASPRY